MSDLAWLLSTREIYSAYLDKKLKTYRANVARTVAALRKMNDPPIDPDKSLLAVLRKYELYGGEKNQRGWLHIDKWLESEAEIIGSRVAEVLSFLCVHKDEETETDDWLGNYTSLRQKVEEAFLKNILATPEAEELCKELQKNDPGFFERDREYHAKVAQAIVKYIEQRPELDRIPYHQKKQRKTKE